MSLSEGRLDGTYYVLESPPSAPGNPPPGQLRSASFADVLTQYHQVRGRRVLTECEACALGDVEASDWAEHVKRLQRDGLGACDGVELIFGCTQIDQASRLTKTLRCTEPMTAKEPRVRALALGIVTGDDRTPMTTTQPYIDRYGADAVRCYTIFMGPHQRDMVWSEDHLGGVHRFLSRLSRLARDIQVQGEPQGEVEGPRSPVPADLELLRKAHQTIDDVTDTMERDRRLHLAIAAIMGLVSTSVRVRDQVHPGTIRFATQTAASLLFPFAPCCAADVYDQLTGDRAWEIPWPVVDPFVREGVPYPASS